MSDEETELPEENQGATTPEQLKEEIQRKLSLRRKKSSEEEESVLLQLRKFDPSELDEEEEDADPEERSRVVEESLKLLPGWIGEKMMKERGFYGLMLTNSTIIAITRIERVYLTGANELWLDAKLTRTTKSINLQGPQLSDLLFSPARRSLTLSVNVSHVLSAFELSNPTALS